MIWDSVPWKNGLLKSAQYLSKAKKQKRFGEYRAEREIFISFYAIRKLIESNKLSNEIKSLNYLLNSYRFIGKGITKLNWHHLDRHYDLRNPVKERISLGELCNQVIHSYVFMFSIKECGSMNGIYICSDWKRSKTIYHIPVQKLISIFTSVGNDDPVSMHYEFDDKKGDYVIIASNKMKNKDNFAKYACSQHQEPNK